MTNDLKLDFQITEIIKKIFFLLSVFNNSLSRAMALQAPSHAHESPGDLENQYPSLGSA